MNHNIITAVTFFSFCAVGCGASQQARTASNPLMGTSLSASTPSRDATIAGITSGDCTKYPTSAVMREKTTVSADGHQICVTRTQAFLADGGSIRVKLDRIRVSTEQGTSPEFVLTPEGNPEFFAYCRVRNKVQGAWTQTFKGCVANTDVLSKSSSQLALHDAKTAELAAWTFPTSPVRVGSAER